MLDNLVEVYSQCSLPPGARSIRVLRLKAGSMLHMIEGSLQVVSLDTDPSRFSCLSYVWGDSSVTERACINGHYLEITKNLSDALRHIRSETEVVITWADAICINQSDIDERSSQVALMTEVYRQCSTVHIWLGMPNSGGLTGNPFRFLDMFAEGQHFYDFPGFHRDLPSGCLIWKENKMCGNILDDFIQVINSPWWTRAWTAQECLLPKKTSIRFGPWMTTWDHILKAIDMKNSHGNGSASCCEEALNAFNPHQRFLIEEWMWHPGWIAKFRTILHETTPPSWFFQSLLAFTGRKCLDPRDKIYSMLSLATHPIYADLKPNYRKDIPTVYTDTFTRMVRETNESLTSFMGGGFGSSMPGLPSWVRDFSQVRAAGVIAGEDKRINFISLYQSSLAPPFVVRWDKNGILHYRGTYADTVKSIGPQLCTSSKDFGDVLRQWFRLCKELLGSGNDNVLRDTFSRIICGDVSKSLDGGPRFRRATESDFPKADAWNQLLNGNVFALDMRGYGGGFNFAVWGRCFFTTCSGRMGLCYPNTLPGDEIWILRHGRVPFIVQPLQVLEAGCASRYSLRGDCFLDGVMDGQLSEKEKLMERPISMV